MTEKDMGCSQSADTCAENQYTFQFVYLPGKFIYQFTVYGYMFNT